MLSFIPGRFLSHLLLFLHLDSGVPQGVTQQVTHKVAQHLTGASHGDNVKLLNSMIQVRPLGSSHIYAGPSSPSGTLLLAHLSVGHFKALGTVFLVKNISRFGLCSGSSYFVGVLKMGD